MAELIQLQDNAELRSALKAAFQDAYELAGAPVRQQLASFQGRPVSSSRHFEQRLRGWFSAEMGFQVEESSLVRAWEHVPRAEQPFPYMSSCVGEQRRLPHVPAALLCSDASSAATESEPSQALLELGIFTFVASRI